MAVVAIEDNTPKALRQPEGPGPRQVGGQVGGEVSWSSQSTVLIPISFSRPVVVSGAISER